jgi:hypothetical protein
VFLGHVTDDNACSSICSITSKQASLRFEVAGSSGDPNRSSLGPGHITLLKRLGLGHIGCVYLPYLSCTDCYEDYGHDISCYREFFFLQYKLKVRYIAVIGIFFLLAL